MWVNLTLRNDSLSQSRHNKERLYASGNTWVKQLCCLAHCQEVSRCRTRGESEECIQLMKHATKGFHPAFETQSRYHQKCKTGVSLVHRKGMNANIANLVLAVSLKMN